jgi:peptidase E
MAAGLEFRSVAKAGVAGMAVKNGIIALMGSGELTSTMVEVHKDLVGSVPAPAKPVFLDTPAGFQLNADLLSGKAVEYFRDHVQRDMAVSSFKNREELSAYDAELAFARLRESHYVLIGPGSPTYAVRQWRETPIPRILTARVRAGGCLVAASAAALTVGRFTLPVYEIYKVGDPLHWVDGIDVLSHFGLSLVVIPHWNNAEGGAHDTRYCYMGEPRFRKLEAMLPTDCTILGLDEHTACLVDLEGDQASVRGIGRVTVRRGGAEIHYSKGDVIPLEVLRGADPSKPWASPGGSASTGPPAQASEPEGEGGFWQEIHGIELLFRKGLESRQTKDIIRAVLELDRLVWQAAMDRESDEQVAQAREILRDMLVFVGVHLDSCSVDADRTLPPLVEELLSLRARFREKKMWAEADEIRDVLQHAGIVVEDTPQGARWKLS